MASVVSITLACAAALAVALTAPASADEWIEVTSNGFDPPTATVDAGEAVHFTNRSGSARSVTAAGGAFASGEIPDGGGYSLALSVPGHTTTRRSPAASPGNCACA